MNEAGRGVAHGFVQGGISELHGGNFQTGFTSGVLTSWGGHGAEALGLLKNSASILAFSAITGGLGAFATGGNLWKGMINGLLVSSLNQLEHKLLYEPRDQGVIRAKEPNVYEKLRESGVVGNFIYSNLDDIAVALQCFPLGLTNPTHLDRSMVLPQEKISGGLIGGGTSLLGPMVKVATRGIKVLNAAQFSHAFKGTGINAATKGGQVIRHYNQGARIVKSSVNSTNQVTRYLNYSLYGNYYIHK